MRYAPQTLAGANRWEDTVGWQFDNRTNRFAYVIQISRSKLESVPNRPDRPRIDRADPSRCMDFVEQITVRSEVVLCQRIQPPLCSGKVPIFPKR